MTPVDAAREALLDYAFAGFRGKHGEELVDALIAAIRAEAGHKASDHDECGESCEVEMSGTLTAAGRRLWLTIQKAHLDDIAAIEAEARAAALDEARAAVANLSGWDKRSVPGGVHVHRGLALAAIDALREVADKA